MVSKAFGARGPSMPVDRTASRKWAVIGAPFETGGAPVAVGLQPHSASSARTVTTGGSASRTTFSVTLPSR